MLLWIPYFRFTHSHAPTHTHTHHHPCTYTLTQRHTHTLRYTVTHTHMQSQWAHPRPSSWGQEHNQWIFHPVSHLDFYKEPQSHVHPQSAQWAWLTPISPWSSPKEIFSWSFRFSVPLKLLTKSPTSLWLFLHRPFPFPPPSSCHPGGFIHSLSNPSSKQGKPFPSHCFHTFHLYVKLSCC